MALQSEAEIQTEIADMLAIFEELFKASSVNTPSPLLNFVARIETLFDDPAGDHSIQSRNQIEAFRAGISNLQSTGFVAGALDPLLNNYAKVLGDIDAPLPPLEILNLIRDDFVDNNKSVKSRDITFVTPVASGTNAGSGRIDRLTVDEDGFDLEAVFVDSKRAEIIRAAGSGALVNAEVFRFRGDDKEKDNLEITGSGLRSDIRSRHGGDSFLRNTSFSQRGGSDVAVTALNDWTVGTSGSPIPTIELDAVNFFRGFPGDSVPKALKVLSDETFIQKFTAANIQLPTTRPAYASLAWNSEIFAAVGPTARIVLEVAGQGVSAVVSGITGWQILRLPLDKNLWPKNLLTVQDPEVKITVSGITGGDLLVDDVILGTMVPFAGHFYWPVGGIIPFLLQDIFNWTDSFVTVDSVIQKWLWIVHQFSLPSNKVGAETFADPTV